MGAKQSDIPKLLDRAKAFLEATEQARGAGTALAKAAPLEIQLYNIATQVRNQLKGFIAMLEDANGTYLKETGSK